MSEYERWAERAIDEDPSTLNDLLGELENAYQSGGEEVEDLISVSFLENLPRPGEAGSQIREMLGPSLHRQLDVIG